jgi:hypothetical protein
MSDVKQTVTNTEDHGVNEDGAAVAQQTKQIHTETAADPQSVVRNVVWFLLGVIEVLLALRFVLKLAGANPANGFVDFVYSVSGVLSAPFDSIFGVTAAKAGAVVQSVFEPSILVAAVVYALLAWGIVKLLTITRNRAA